jgi:hypothetical protein
MAEPVFDLTPVSEGLWSRMRDVILTERRLEAFAFAPDAPAGSPGRLEALAGDRDVVRSLAEDMALRALARAADGLNFRILSAMAAESVPLDALASRLGLPGLALSERLAELAGLGLAVRDLERGSVAGTSAGRGLAGLVEALREALGERMIRELPGLLGRPGA